MKILLPFLLFCFSHARPHAQPLRLPERGIAASLTPLTGEAPDLGPYFKGLRAAGYSRVWLMVDSDCADRSGLFLDAAAAEGLAVIIGAQTGADMAAAAAVCNRFWNHKAVYRFNGKPVFSGFDRCSGTSAFVDAMARVGRGREEYLIWVMVKRPVDDCPGLAFLGVK